MRLKLRLSYSAHQDYKDRKIMAWPDVYDSGDSEITVRRVTVDVPSGIDMTEKEFNDAVYLKRLSVAEREVMDKRDELFRAEEVVKNMLAIPAEIVD